MAAKKQQTVSGIKVTTKKDGFRRGGREWHGTTELPLTELTEEQLKQVRNESMLIVSDIEIAVQPALSDSEQSEGGE